MKKQLYALRNRITSEVNAVASKELVQARETCLRWTLEQSPSALPLAMPFVDQHFCTGFGANRHVGQPRTWAATLASRPKLVGLGTAA